MSWDDNRGDEQNVTLPLWVMVSIIASVVVFALFVFLIIVIAPYSG